jgi:hypothetical protein
VHVGLARRDADAAVAHDDGRDSMPRGAADEPETQGLLNALSFRPASRKSVRFTLASKRQAIIMRGLAIVKRGARRYVNSPRSLAKVKVLAAEQECLSGHAHNTPE